MLFQWTDDSACNNRMCAGQGSRSELESATFGISASGRCRGAGRGRCGRLRRSRRTGRGVTSEAIRDVPRHPGMNPLLACEPHRNVCGTIICTLPVMILMEYDLRENNPVFFLHRAPRSRSLVYFKSCRKIASVFSDFYFSRFIVHSASMDRGWCWSCCVLTGLCVFPFLIFAVKVKCIWRAGWFGLICKPTVIWHTVI